MGKSKPWKYSRAQFTYLEATRPCAGKSKGDL